MFKNISNKNVSALDLKPNTMIIPSYRALKQAKLIYFTGDQISNDF